jgi:LEA14-like dessication related protein
MRNPLLFIFYCFVGGCVFLSCGSVKDPDFIGIENARVGRVGLKESTLKLSLHYFNPNNYSINLKEAEGDAWIDSIFLGHFLIDTLIRIPANADFRLPVKLKMDMSQVLQNMTMLYSKNEVWVKIEGKAKIGKGSIFIHYPIRYEGKQNLNELMKQHFDRLSIPDSRD